MYVLPGAGDTLRVRATLPPTGTFHCNFIHYLVSFVTFYKQVRLQLPVV